MSSFQAARCREEMKRLVCKGKYSLFVKVERSWRQAVSDEIFLTLRCERISSENLSPFKPVLGEADGQRK